MKIEIIQAPEPPRRLADRRIRSSSPCGAPPARVYPGVVVTESMTTGGTDSRFFRRRGVPAYGFFPVLISKELAASVHGVDERLPGSGSRQSGAASSTRR